MAKRRAAPTARTYDLAALEDDHPEMMMDTFVLAFAFRTGVAVGAQTGITVKSRVTKSQGKRDTVVWNLRVPGNVSPGKIGKFGNTFAAHIVTEYAAIAVAGAQTATDLGVRMSEVTLVGDRGDYWMSTTAGKRAGMCEISGTTAHNVETLFATKRKQILRNRMVATCYVTVTNFTQSEGAFCRVR